MGIEYYVVPLGPVLENGPSFELGKGPWAALNVTAWCDARGMAERIDALLGPDSEWSPWAVQDVLPAAWVVLLTAFCQDHRWRVRIVADDAVDALFGNVVGSRYG